MNLLSDYKAEISGAMRDIFETFSRTEPMTFFKPNEEEVVIFDSSFNADLSEYNNPNVTLIENSRSFQCRIIYPRRENTYDGYIAGGSNIPIKGITELGIVNIQFREEALDYIKDTIRFTFMGEKYQKVSAIRRIGILDTFDVFQLSLKQVN